MRYRVLAVGAMIFMTAVAVQAAEDAPDAKKLAELRKRIEERRTELNGSQWEVSLVSNDPKIKGEKDTFTFQDGKMSSTNLEKRGFGQTNYTVTPPSGGSESSTWETMKTGKEGIVFMRGEWEKESMRGSVTEQLEEGKKTLEYSFTTKARVVVSPNSKENKEEDIDLEGDTAINNSEVLVSKEDTPEPIPAETEKSDKKKKK